MAGKARRACCVGCAPCCVYFVLLGLCPAVFQMYCEMYVHYADDMLKDRPVNITEMEIIHGVHSYEETLPYTDWNVDRPMIFRGFSDCAKTFDNEIVPKRAKQIDKYMKIAYFDETRPGNTYVRGIMNDRPVMRSLEDTLNAASPDEYASFLRMFDQTDYQVLMNATWDHAKHFTMDTSFISHFSWPVVSAAAHAGPAIYTYSLQCYGVKSWLFWKDHELNNMGHHTVVQPAGAMLTGSPHSIVRVPSIRANLLPGDLLFFPPMWYHAVASSAGKNVMFAMRRVGWKTFLTSFLNAPRDTVLWGLRTMYDKPANVVDKIIKHYLNFGKTRGDDMDTKRLGHEPTNLGAFHHRYVSTRVQRIPEEYRHYNGMHDFNMPEFAKVRPGTTPSKIITTADEMWAMMYKEYRFPWVMDKIQNKSVWDSPLMK